MKILPKNIAFITATRGAYKTTYAEAICKQLKARMWNSYSGESNLEKVLKHGTYEIVVLDELPVTNTIALAKKFPAIRFLVVVNIEALVNTMQ